MLDTRYYKEQRVRWLVLIFQSIFFIVLFNVLISDQILASSESLQEKKERIFNQLRILQGLEEVEKPLKCGLIHPEDIQSITRILSPAEKELIKIIFSRSVLDTFYISEEGNFKIHYDTTGYNTPLPEYNLDQHVPDWVIYAAEAAERSWRLIIDTLEFSPPPINNNDGPEIDIYVKELGGSPYGWTWDDGPVRSTPRQYDYYGYIEIDNDFSESGYYTNGLNALRVTVAHEFFHVVQLGYNWYPSNGLPGCEYGDTYFLEWCSVWMEERAYPEVNDYYLYLNTFFQTPSLSIWKPGEHKYNWYALGTFIRYILDRYDTDSRLLSKVWERIKTKYAFQALQETLEEEGLNLAQLWNEFSSSCYYTAHRYDEELSPSPDAIDFPLLQFSRELDIVLEDSSAVVNVDSEPFSTNPIRITFLKNHFLEMECDQKSGDSFLGSFILSKYFENDILTNFQMNSKIFLGESRILDTLVVFVTNNSIIDTLHNFNFNVNIILDTVNVPTKFLKLYPNPWSLMNHKDIKFELQLGERFEHITLFMFDIRGRQIFNRKYGAEYLSLGITNLNVSSSEIQSKPLPSGVYFVFFECGKNKLVRKFTLIK